MKSKNANPHTPFDSTRPNAGSGNLGPRILVNADVIAQNDECRQLLKTVTFPIILMRRGRENELLTSDSDNCHSIFVPDVHMTRTGQVKVALLLCLAKGLVTRGDCVVCLSGIDHTGLLDTIFALNLSTEPELLSGPNTIELQGDFRVEVFQRVLSIATELGVEGAKAVPSARYLWLEILIAFFSSPDSSYSIRFRDTTSHCGTFLIRTLRKPSKNFLQSMVHF